VVLGGTAAAAACSSCCLFLAPRDESLEAVRAVWTTKTKKPKQPFSLSFVSASCAIVGDCCVLDIGVVVTQSEVCASCFSASNDRHS